MQNEYLRISTKQRSFLNKYIVKKSLTFLLFSFNFLQKFCFQRNELDQILYKSLSGMKLSFFKNAKESVLTVNSILH